MRVPRINRWWLAGGLLLLAHVAVSLRVPACYPLTVFGDIIASVLLLMMAGEMLLNAIKSKGRESLFWSLMGAGAMSWCLSQVLWSHFEVVLRVNTPDPFIGDVIIFIRLVPMMAALALRPQEMDAGHRRTLGGIDFLMLLVWWLYLYMMVVIPWQYIVHVPAISGPSFNLLYIGENAVFLGALLYVRHKGTAPWKRTYAHLFGAGALYMLASGIINFAIDHKRYHTGSIYDVPLLASYAWFIWAARVGRSHVGASARSNASAEKQGVWSSRIAMLAMLSMPVIAGWSVFVSKAPKAIVDFRLAISLLGMFILGGIVFVKQHVLDNELIFMLAESRRNYVALERVQEQLIQSEKLASLGAFVAGAAHEINNPLTAILGYSDLLSTDPRYDDELRSIADKMKQQARRTKDMVSNLLRFAKQTPTEKSLISLNNIVENTLQLRELELAGRKIEIKRNLQGDLAPVWGDPNQLMDVCFHITGNAADALQERGGGQLMVRTWSQNGHAVLEFSDNGPGMKEPNRVFDPFYTTKAVGKGTGLGLSACYGIVKEHRGEIECANAPLGGAVFTIRFPIAPNLTPKKEMVTA